jgi:outer membrane protein TolC
VNGPGRLAVLLAAGLFAAAWPAPAAAQAGASNKASSPPSAGLAELEKRAWEHNPAMAAAAAALRSLDRRIAEAGSDPALLAKLNETRTQVLTDRQRMSVRFRTLFFHTLNDQKRVESRERLAQVAREALAVTDQLFNVGAADGPDRLAIANEVAVMESALASARFELEALRAVLLSTIGDPSLELGPLTGDLVAEMPRIDREEWRQRLLRESPPLKNAAADVAAAEEALAKARQEPNGAVAEAEAALAQARLRAEHIRVTVEIGFAETYAGYQSFVKDLEMYRGGALERAERAYEETLRHYQEMTAAYPQVLLARRAWFQMEDTALDALQNSWAAALEIQALLPFQLPQSLTQPAPAPAASGKSSGD